ncbi:hypothetical protein [Paenibacillus wynnii]|uniref:hypothetical protein n=1 Tax=Paenibacillus wynnii TaxID=268407 RepID=UPI0012F9D523|nr:hypothetical protein [Paenibacillus wynnii]
MRKVDIESLLYCGVMGLVFGLVVILTIVIGRRKKTFAKSLFQSIGLAVLLYGMACLWWFSYVQDGLAQLFGVMIYGIAFAVNVLVNTGILYFAKKRFDKHTR